MAEGGAAAAPALGPAAPGLVGPRLPARVLSPEVEALTPLGALIQGLQQAPAAVEPTDQDRSDAAELIRLTSSALELLSEAGAEIVAELKAILGDAKTYQHRVERLLANKAAATQKAPPNPPGLEPADESAIDEASDLAAIAQALRDMGKRLDDGFQRVEKATAENTKAIESFDTRLTKVEEVMDVMEGLARKAQNYTYNTGKTVSAASIQPVPNLLGAIVPETLQELHTYDDIKNLDHKNLTAWIEFYGFAAPDFVRGSTRSREVRQDVLTAYQLRLFDWLRGHRWDG
ncbi:hypothetical protein JCM10450v2_005143 [Rhodotorula kratochvilovae]